MTNHAHLPRTFALPRTPRPPSPDAVLLSRAVEKVGHGFPSIGAVRLALAVMSA